MKRWSLFRRREVVLPTAWGWLAILLTAGGGLRLGAPLVYDYLACDRYDGPAEFITVEGWVSDTAIGPIRTIAAGSSSARVFTTGGPIEMGEWLSEYRDWAHVTAARLVQAGAVASNRVTAVPSPRVRKDRTYASALALRAQLQSEGIATGRVALVSVGPHARRSRLLFRKALAPHHPVEVVGLPADRYGRGDWWRSSEGFKAVTYELMANAYTQVQFLFGAEP